MFIKKYSDGNWYLCRRTSRKYMGKPSLTNWFLIKWRDVHGKVYSTQLNTKIINFPDSFAGKKIRFKVEVLK